MAHVVDLFPIEAAQGGGLIGTGPVTIGSGGIRLALVLADLFGPAVTPTPG